MTSRALSEVVAATAAKLGIPGASVGVWADGEEALACHGVTSVVNPLPVDPHTLHRLGSVTKTYTATALMRLVAEGQVDLEAPVRRYVPELALADERAAAEITVLNLLNHTAGLDWRIIVDTGEGDDALAREAAKLAELKPIAPPGTRASYSQAGYNLAGRLLEKVTGLTYERAIATLLFEPLGMKESFFDRDEVMTRRFAVGHELGEDGKLSIARPWKHWRADNPGAGLATSVRDQLRWARFHLGDGCAEDGTRVMPAAALQRMKQHTVTLRGSALGDAFGICWFLRDVDGVRTVGHGGSATGQFAELLMVPERRFAVASLANAGPNGVLFNQTVVRWALASYVGVDDRDAEPLPYDEARAREVVGRYENDAMTFTVSADGADGVGPAGLRLDVRIKPALRAAAKMELPADLAPADFGLLAGGTDGYTDGYVVTSGGLKGQRGFFTRDERGVVVGVDLAGRLFKRVRGSE